MLSDTYLLNWLEKQDGAALVNDDGGRWAVSFDEMQNVPEKEAADIRATFFIEAAQWKPTIREAIQAAIDMENEDGGDMRNQPENNP